MTMWWQYRQCLYSHGRHILVTVVQQNSIDVELDTTKDGSNIGNDVTQQI